MDGPTGGLDRRKVPVKMDGHKSKWMFALGRPLLPTKLIDKIGLNDYSDSLKTVYFLEFLNS